MVQKPEKDEVTGAETTGHEWDGIKELNNPLPKWWLYVFFFCCIWAFGYWVIYPAWPVGDDFTKGIVGHSQRDSVAQEVINAKLAQSEYVDLIAALDLEQIQADQTLFQFVMAGGKAAFGDNCAGCHGRGGQGGAGFPNLVDDAWIWGGDLEAIYLTISHGIRNENEDSRQSEMPAFGRDEILDREQIIAVANHVLSLSGADHKADLAAQGAEIFEENCAACHGEQGEGMYAMGAPRLNDAIWLYGGREEDIIEMVQNSRAGNMPAWRERLGDETVKQLALYVHSLGGGE